MPTRILRPRPLASSLNRFKSHAAMLAALAMAGTTATKAAIVNWDGDAADLLWGSATNWSGDASPADTDDLVFGTAGAGTIDLGLDRTANSLRFSQNGFTLGLASTALKLTNTSGAITVDTGIVGQINAVLAGTSGLTLAGGGTLTLAGANTFTGTVAVNAGILSVAADTNLGAVANGLTVNGGTLNTTGTFTSTRALTLGAAGGTLNVASSTGLTLSTAIVANANVLTKSGAGSLTLSATSTRTGLTTISNGTVVLGNISALGTGDIGVDGSSSKLQTSLTGTVSALQNVALTNGGTLSFSPASGTSNTLQFTGKTVTVGTGGGTIDNGPLTLGAAKVLLTAGQLAGSGTITKTGAGTLQLSGANGALTSPWNVNGGVVEVGNATSLGTGAVTVNTGGEVGLNAVTVANSFTLSGGTISSNAATGAVFSGPVNVTSNSNIGLRFFQTTTTGSTFSLTGGLSGAGNLAINAPTAQALIVQGSTSGFSGGYTLNNFASLTLRNASSTVASTGSAGLNAYYYNFGNNPTASGNPAVYATDLLALDPRVFTRTDSAPNIPFNSNGTYPITPVPGFQYNANDGVMWKGLINITSGGSYTFSSNVDDQDILYIDGVQVGAHTSNNGSTFTALGNAITLSAGAHSFVYKFSQGTGGGYSVLRYSGPDTSNTAVNVPDSVFTTGSLSPIDIAPITANGTSGPNTLTTSAPSRVTTLTLGSGASFALSSDTIDDLTITGNTTLNGGAVTLSANSGGLVFSGPITGTSTGLTFGGGYLKVLNNANTYTGPTTVSAGQLDLNSASGLAIPTNLTVNVSNTAATANVNSVNYRANDQIADAATVTLASGNVGIFNLGAFNDTVAGLSITSGRITGSGTLTLGNLSTSTFASGSIESGLGGSGTLTKSTTGTLSLSGANSYTGVTDIQAGILLARNGSALGAAGAGNGTTVNTTGQLQFLGALTVGEDITSNVGAGVRSLGGLVNLTKPLVYGAAVANGTLTVDSGVLSLTSGATINGSAGNTNLTINGNGELLVAAPIALGTGTLTKSGNGSLIFGYDTLGAIPALTHSSGAIGFSGTQTGTFTAPATAGLAYKFNSDPGAAASIVAASGSTVIAGFPVTQAFLGRFSAASAGSLILTSSSSTNLDFSTGPALALGARGLVTYSGVITPTGGTYRFGGNPGGDAIQNVLAINQPMTGANSLVVSGGGTLDLTRTPSSLTGSVNVNGATTVITSTDSFGTGVAGNGLTFGGGATLRIAHTSGNSGAIFSDFGYNSAAGTSRTLNLGTGGVTLDIPARVAADTALYLSSANGIAGVSGTSLTKSGLGILYIGNTTNFNGADLILAANGNQVDVRAQGTLTGVNSITINQSATLNVDNTNGFGTARPTSYLGAFVGDRVPNAATITLNGGGFLFTPRGAASSNTETVGTVVLNSGLSNLNFNSNPTGSIGTDFTITTLRHNTGGSLRLGGNAGTFGASGANNTRVVVGNLQLNGGAPAAPVDDQILSFADAFGTDLVQYEVTTAPASLRIATYTSQSANTTATTFTPTAGTIYQIDSGTTTAGAANLTTLATGNQSIGGLKFNSGDTNQTLQFGTATDTLFIGTATSFGGAIVAANPSPTAARTLTIGAAAGSGKLTAGPSSGATGTQELFFHFRGSGNTNAITLNVNSSIVDNGTTPVAVVKDDDGTIQLQATANTNTYTGGSFVNRGRINVTTAGSLGFGAVSVKNSTLQLNQGSSVQSGTGNPASTAPVYTAIDNSELFLNSTTSAFTGATDRFDIAAGSTITSLSTTANFGLNSLTYIAPGTNFSGGGQVRLAAGAIVRASTVNQNVDIGTTNMIKNLPTDASLYLNVASTTGDATTLTLGAGTPWRGLATGRPTANWSAGTIFANSDFELQGTVVDNGMVTLTMGGTGTGTYNIVNQSGRPINALISGQVALAESSPVSMPSDMTFVVSAGAILQPNLPNSFGSGSNVAKVLVQAGGTLDPGAYAIVGSASNQAQGFVYPVAGPINASQTIIESGGRLLANDGSGIGTSPVGSVQFRSGSVFDIATNQSFIGANAGLVNNGQFVFDAGAIMRLNSDNVFRLNQFVNGAANGNRLIYEVAGNNRSITDAVNPMIVSAANSPQIEVFDLTLGNGGMLTNDGAERTISERRGRIVLNDGAILAGTNQTYLTIQEGLAVASGATITIGSNQVVDGLPKLGAVQLAGPQSNVIPNSANFVLLNGAQLGFNSTNVWPDTHDLNLPIAVSNFTGLVNSSQVQPGNGTSLLLNTNNFVEVMGSLTGPGAVISNVAAGGLGVGFGAASDFTFAGVFKSTNGQNPGLVKLGPTKMTLTGASDSTLDILVEQGTLELSGTGAVKGTIRSMKGASIVIDNTATAVNNRTNGSGTFWVPSGGSYTVIGNGTTPVTESFANFANSSGTIYNVTQVPGYTTLNVIPGAATTTVFANSFENFVTGGIANHRTGTWVLNSPTVSNGPITFGTASQMVPRAGNSSNGLIELAIPNFGANGGNGVAAGGIFGSAGTIVAPSRPDLLGDGNNDGVPDGFMTEDGVNYTATVTSGSSTVTVPTTVGLAVGMPVSGTGIPANTTIASIVNGTSITISANATAAGTSLAIVNGGLRLLANSEYTNGFRDNQTVSTNVKLSGVNATSGEARVQTLTLTPGSTLNVAGTLPLNTTSSRLQLNSNGIFVQPGGTATINGSTSGGTQAYLQVAGGSSLFLHTFGTLNLNIPVFSDNAVVKTGTGTLNVGAGAFTAYRGTLQVDDGVVNLAPNNSNANTRVQNGFNPSGPLFLNGGTINLNGNSQFFSRIENNNPLPGRGGTITSSSPATLGITGTGTTTSIFSGTIAGQISLDKMFNNTVMLTNDNTYSGATIQRTGTLILRDSGKLSGTSGVEIQNSLLQLDNSYLSNIADRIPATTPVVLKGGTINITGAAGQVASQTFNALTLSSGLNTLTSNPGGSGATEINVGNLVRPASGGSFLNLVQNYGFLGAAGNTTSGRTFITNVNGSALPVTNNILPAWVVVAGDNFATYSATQGIGALGNTTDGFAPYDSTDATAATATQNVNDGTARTFATSKTINSWRIAPNASVTMTLNQGVGLTLASGGLLTNNNNTTSISGAVGATGQSITSGTGELDVFVNQNNSGINVPITGAINFVKSGSGGLNLNPSSTYSSGVTVTSGSATVAVTNTTGLAVGQLITGTGIPANTTITAIAANASVTISNAATAAGTSFAVQLGNSYTGSTFVNGGTLTLNMTGGNGNTVVAVPGDIFINNATVTEANAVGQLKTNANITVSGGGRFNVLAAAGVTETIGSITALDSAGAGVAAGFNTILDRTGAQLTSTVNLSAANAITATNSNPSLVPLIGSNLGILSFTSPTTAILNINSPVSTQGLAAVGLRIDSQIGAIPTTVSEGSLIKSGNGMLVLGPLGNPTFAAGVTTANSNVITVTNTAGLVPGMQVSGTNIAAGSYVVSVTNGTTFTISQAPTVSGTGITITGQTISQFGNPSTLTDVFNIQTGVVRADTSGALGGNFANTTVQNGAVLLGANGSSQVLTGSVTLKDGATLGATLNAFTLGAATTTVANQSVLNIPSGTANIATYDYFLPTTNSGNITVNSRLTGAGTIELVGQQVTQGSGGGGVFTLGNPILTGTGSNDFSGIINVGTNAVLKNQVAVIAGSATTRTTGSAFGAATINLKGGRLTLRDDGQAAGDTNNLSVTYGTNVNLLADSFLDSNRQTSTTVTGTTINMGVLTVPSGTRALTVDSGNSYITAFSRLDGPGTLVKAGSGLLALNAIGTGASTPSFTFAGPIGRVVAPTASTTTNANVIFGAASSTFQDFSVNGYFITPASKTLNANGTFSVNTNTENNSGTLGVTNSTTINAPFFVNNGTVGAIGGTASLNATTAFRGNGIYQTLGAVGVAGATSTISSNPLNLNGNFDQGTLRVAGGSTASDVVTLNGTTHNFTAAEVESGVLRFSPTGAATTTGPIRVFGSPASIASTTAAAISAVSGTLVFDAGANGITHSGNITNNGLLQVTSGTTTVNGVIAGTALQYVPGLLEGYVVANVLDTANGTRPANPGNFGIRLEPRMAQTNIVTQQAVTGHTENDLWIYTGYVKDDDGVFSFAQNYDDRFAVWIDGQLVLNASNGGTSRVVSTAFKDGQASNSALVSGSNGGIPSQNFGAGVTLPGRGDGWHLIEIRMNNGAGGAGPINGNGFANNFGFGYKNGIGALDGADYVKPVDNGTGNLFVTPVGGSGQIDVAAGSTLKAQGFNAISNLKLSGTGATMEITSASANAADAVTSTGGTAVTPNSLKVAANASADVASLVLNTGSTLSVSGVSTSNVNVGTSTLDGTVSVDGANLKVTGVGSGPGTGVVKVNTGNVTVSVGGSIAGSLLAVGGKTAIQGNGILATSGFIGGGMTESGGTVVLDGVVQGNANVSGGVLNGGGSIVGSLTVSGGTVAPGLPLGAAYGSLKSGDLDLQSGSTLALEIGGAPNSALKDQLGVTGAVSLAGQLQLSLLNGFSPGNGDTFFLVLNDGVDPINGTFQGLPDNSTVSLGGYSWLISYSANGDAGTVGNDVALIAQVPEPGTVAVLLGGAGAMLGLQRFRRRR